MKFIHRGGGGHGEKSSNGVSHKPGQLVVSEDPLHELFPDRFELIPEPISVKRPPPIKPAVTK